MAEYTVLLKEIREETSRLEQLHGVLFKDEALLLAAHVAMHPQNQTAGELRERAIDVLNKACKRKHSMKNHQKELDKLKYSLRRASVEFEQLTNENADSCNRDSWLSHLEKELKERTHNYFQILQLLDAKVKNKFKETQVIGIEETAEIASDLTGIPVSWLRTPPEERYTRLRERLQKRIVRQDHVIEAIMEVLLKHKGESSWSGPPVGSFLLVGPYGTGKAELAKAIAIELYDDEDCLARIDMEQYMEPDLDSVSCLVRSLTQTVKNQPYSVLLFDKIEKAHSSVIDTLISSLSNENASDLRNTLIIMTSDVEEEDMRNIELAHVLWQGLHFFKPELLQFLDKMILMNWRCPLKDTTRLLLREWASKQSSEGDRTITVCPSDSALTQIVCNASTKYGATRKGLERWMAEKVFSQLSNMVDQDHQIADSYITIYIITEEKGELASYCCS
ncbi:chaperone protein ClpB1-like [Pistacia vera]|uniref:chaperone protein ClpB1-like n=1 Tax=Pistacia vera TaxID=55513 RepID=UPI0012631CE5|nr:chaperone protein ClpB1-like [Pistacia vera]